MSEDGRGQPAGLPIGASTNDSVEASARTAGKLGFAVQVVADATFAFARRDFGGAWRSADDVHLMALSNLDGEYARIVDTAGVRACCVQAARRRARTVASLPAKNHRRPGTSSRSERSLDIPAR